MKVKSESEMKSLSCVRLFVTLWTVAHQAPLFMGFSRQEYWSGVPFRWKHGTIKFFSWAHIVSQVFFFFFKYFIHVVLTGHIDCMAEWVFRPKCVVPKFIVLNHHVLLFSFSELRVNLRHCSFQVMPIPHLVYHNSRILWPRKWM